MLLFPVLSRVAAYPALSVLYLARFKMLAASLVAFISSCKFSAKGACAFHEPVWKEAHVMGAICQPYDLWIYIPFIDEDLNYAIRSFVVGRRIRVPEKIELNFHFFDI